MFATPIFDALSLNIAVLYRNYFYCRLWPFRDCCILRSQKDNMAFSSIHRSIFLRLQLQYFLQFT
ncbi:hypothetical protein CW304_00465 [Bacillus sp. UFRGS-B20]|nr:hypothetical protein CW304_00465 [Bacillus sp. UFRGS-B20]